MQTTYHLSSAQEINTDILEKIKAAFQNKPITITVEDEEDMYELTDELKAVLDEHLQEDQATYLTAEDSLSLLRKKYGI